VAALDTLDLALALEVGVCNLVGRRILESFENVNNGCILSLLHVLGLKSCHHVGLKRLSVMIAPIGEDALENWGLLAWHNLTDINHLRISSVLKRGNVLISSLIGSFNFELVGLGAFPDVQFVPVVKNVDILGNHALLREAGNLLHVHVTGTV